MRCFDIRTLSILTSVIIPMAIRRGPLVLGMNAKGTLDMNGCTKGNPLYLLVSQRIYFS